MREDHLSLSFLTGLLLFLKCLSLLSQELSQEN